MPTWRLNDTVFSYYVLYMKIKRPNVPTQFDPLVDHGNESKGSRIFTRYTTLTQKGFKIAVISIFVVLLQIL